MFYRRNRREDRKNLKNPIPKAQIETKPSTLETTALHSTFDELEKHLRCLTALGEDTNHWHFLSLIMSKLPREVIIKLEEMKKPAELWSVQLLRKNLQAHLTARANAERQ